MTNNLQIINADCLAALRGMATESVHCCVTSPPYWGLRDYGVVGQLGLERTPEEYVARMVDVFREVRRVLRPNGTCWVNLGDSYAANGGHADTNCDVRRSKLGIGSKPEHSNRSFRARAGNDCDPKRGVAANGQPFKNGAGAGLKPKDLVGIPWRVAFALQADGWWLRQDIIWHKPNPMPESVTDRCTKAHEYVFLLTKAAQYFYDAEAIKEPCSESTHARVSQDLAGQIGSHRANGGGKTNGPMKAVIAGSTRKLAEAGSGVAANRSYESALALVVGSRNKRSVWSVTSAQYSGAHFATFPPDLIKPCILAGTSACGCCAKCGAPWERVVERSGGTIGHDWNQNKRGKAHGGEDLTKHINVDPATTDGSYRVRTLGWQATCECADNGQSSIADSQGSGLVPCTVLDPFGGSGTTGQVALELGRRAVLIELNPQYIPLIEHRTNVTLGLKL